MAQNLSSSEADQDAFYQPIVLIGASYAKSWPLDKLHGVDIINKGVGGEQSSEMLSRFETDVLANNPSHVIIWGFINDIFRSEPSELGKKLELTKTNFKEMVQISFKNNIIPILSTEVTIRPKSGMKEALTGFLYGTILGKSSYQDYVNQHVDEINQWISNYAVQKKILLLDLKSVLADEKGYRRKSYATRDGSHISVKGYKALTTYTEEKLLGIIPKNNTN